MKKAKVSKYGQWKYPGEDTIIPNANGSITMKGVPYPVLGIDDRGNRKLMMPGGEYQFPGNSVYEIPMMAAGGIVNPCPPGKVPDGKGNCVDDLTTPPIPSSSLYPYYTDQLAILKANPKITNPDALVGQMIRVKRAGLCKSGECWKEEEKITKVPPEPGPKEHYTIKDSGNPGHSYLWRYTDDGNSGYNQALIGSVFNRDFLNDEQQVQFDAPGGGTAVVNYDPNIHKVYSDTRDVWQTIEDERGVKQNAQNNLNREQQRINEENAAREQWEKQQREKQNKRIAPPKDVAIPPGGFAYGGELDHGKVAGRSRTKANNNNYVLNQTFYEDGFIDNNSRRTLKGFITGAPKPGEPGAPAKLAMGGAKKVKIKSLPKAQDLGELTPEQRKVYDDRYIYNREHGFDSNESNRSALQDAQYSNSGPIYNFQPFLPDPDSGVRVPSGKRYPLEHMDWSTYDPWGDMMRDPEYVKRYNDPKNANIQGRMKSFFDNMNAETYYKNLDNVKAWERDWYSKRAQLPQFTDVANKRLNLINSVNMQPFADEGEFNKFAPDAAAAFFTDGNYIGIPGTGFSQPSNYVHERSHWFDWNAPQNDDMYNGSYFRSYLKPGSIPNPVYNDEDEILTNIIPSEYKFPSGVVDPLRLGENDTTTYDTETEKIEANMPKSSDSVNGSSIRIPFKGDEKTGDDSDINYYYKPTEVRARLNEWRFEHNIDPTKNYTNEELQDIINSDIKSGKDNNFDFYKIIRGRGDLLKQINDSYVSTGDKENPDEMPKAQRGLRKDKNKNKVKKGKTLFGRPYQIVETEAGPDLWGNERPGETTRVKTVYYKNGNIAKQKIDNNENGGDEVTWHDKNGVVTAERNGDGYRTFSNGYFQSINNVDFENVKRIHDEIDRINPKNKLQGFVQRAKLNLENMSRDGSQPGDSFNTVWPDWENDRFNYTRKKNPDVRKSRAKFQGGGLPNDYQDFLGYSETAPENRRPDSEWQYGNPRQYDHYGMWDALGKPENFNQALEKNPQWQPDPYDNMYHGFSTNPNTGVWLKSHIPGESHPGDTGWMEYKDFMLSNDRNWGGKNQNLVYDPDLQRMRYVDRKKAGGVPRAQSIGLKKPNFNQTLNIPQQFQQAPNLMDVHVAMPQNSGLGDFLEVRSQNSFIPIDADRYGINKFIPQGDDTQYNDPALFQQLQDLQTRINPLAQSNTASRQQYEKKVLDAINKVESQNYDVTKSGYIPESIRQSEDVKQNGLNGCISGVCYTLNEAGEPVKYYSNSMFQDAIKAGTEKDWALDFDTKNISGGDIIQFTRDREGPHHAALVVPNSIVNNEDGTITFEAFMNNGDGPMYKTTYTLDPKEDRVDNFRNETVQLLKRKNVSDLDNLVNQRDQLKAQIEAADPAAFKKGRARRWNTYMPGAFREVGVDYTRFDGQDPERMVAGSMMQNLNLEDAARLLRQTTISTPKPIDGINIKFDSKYDVDYDALRKTAGFENILNQVNDPEFKMNFMKDMNITNREYNAIVSNTFGIYGQETGFGTKANSIKETDVARKTDSVWEDIKSRLKGEGPLKKDIDEDYSRGLTQVKLRNIKGQDRRQYDINKESIESNPTKAFIAAMIANAQNLPELRKLASKGETDALDMNNYLDFIPYMYNQPNRIRRGDRKTIEEALAEGQDPAQALVIDPNSPMANNEYIKNVRTYADLFKFMPTTSPMPIQKFGGALPKAKRGLRKAQDGTYDYFTASKKLNDEKNRIAQMRNNVIPISLSHSASSDNKPFNIRLPEGQHYCTTRACEIEREAGFPINQVTSGYKIMKETTPENGWYPTKYDELLPGDIAQVVRNNGSGHTMVSTGDAYNMPELWYSPADRDPNLPREKGFFSDNGSGRDFDFMVPPSENELAYWMDNVKNMNYYTYKGNLPQYEKEYSSAVNNYLHDTSEGDAGPMAPIDAIPNKQNGGPPYKIQSSLYRAPNIVRQEGREYYDPMSETIYLQPSYPNYSYEQAVKNHEKAHHLQKLKGKYSTTELWPGPLKEPAIGSTDDMIFPYYNRTTEDAYGIMNAVPKSTLFGIPEDIAVMGFQNKTYDTPGTAEYEAEQMVHKKQGGAMKKVKIKSLPKAQITGELKEQALQRDWNRQQATAWDPNQLNGAQEIPTDTPVAVRPMTIGLPPKDAPKKSKEETANDAAKKTNKKAQNDATLWLLDHPEYMLDADGNPVLKSSMEANAPAEYLTEQQKALKEEFIRERNAEPLQQTLGTLGNNPQTAGAAERYANTELAAPLLEKNPRDKYNTRAEWLESFNPQERAIIQASNKSYKFNPNVWTTFARALQTEGNRDTQWQQNLDLTQEEKNAPVTKMDRLGLLAPLAVPTYGVQRLLTGDYKNLSDLSSGDTPKPYFGDDGTMRDYYQPDAQSIGTGLWQAALDPLNAIGGEGIGLGMLDDLRFAKFMDNAIAKSVNEFSALTPNLHAFDPKVQALRNLSGYGTGIGNGVLPGHDDIFRYLADAERASGVDRSYLMGLSDDFLRHSVVGADVRDPNYRVSDDLLGRWQLEDARINNRVPLAPPPSEISIPITYDNMLISASTPSITDRLFGTISDRVGALSRVRTPAQARTFMRNTFGSVTDGIRGLRRIAGDDVPISQVRNNFRNYKASNPQGPVNKSLLGKNETKSLLKDKSEIDKLEKLNDSEFRDILITPDGRIKFPEKYTGPKQITKIETKDWVEEFNGNLELLNRIIAENNTSGREYWVTGITEDGVLKFRTAEGRTSSMSTYIKPGKFKGEVQDIADTKYMVDEIPGLQMAGASPIFGDAVRGTGTYKSLNEYLKKMELGRVKSGMNVQSNYSKPLWENAIKKGDAFGFYASPGLVHGIMKKEGGVKKKKPGFQVLTDANGKYVFVKT